MNFETVIPFLPSDDLDATENFFVSLGFALVLRDDMELQLGAGAVELRFSHLPGHPRIAGTNFSGKTVALRTGSASDTRRRFKQAGIQWQGWTPPHLGTIEIRGGRRCFAFSDTDGNLFWVEEVGLAPGPSQRITRTIDE